VDDEIGKGKEQRRDSAGVFDKLVPLEQFIEDQFHGWQRSGRHAT
jgi:hypothetical protein